MKQRPYIEAIASLLNVMKNKGTDFYLEEVEDDNGKPIGITLEVFTDRLAYSHFFDYLTLDTEFYIAQHLHKKVKHILEQVEYPKAVPTCRKISEVRDENFLTGELTLVTEYGLSVDLRGCNVARITVQPYDSNDYVAIDLRKVNKEGEELDFHRERVVSLSSSEYGDRELQDEAMKYLGYRIER